MLKKYTLETTVFCSWAIVMIYEILGSRIYGPYFGTSTLVWTTLIWVILASLSLGYYIGGIYADKKPTLGKLSSLIFAASICMFFVFLLKDDLLYVFQQSNLSFAVSTFISAIILFFPLSFLLWIVSPYAVKLKIDSIETGWQTIWKMYALGTFWSIIWTFAAGFYLIPNIGTNILLLILTVALLLLSFFISTEKILYTRWVYAVILLSFIAYYVDDLEIRKANGYVDVDTKYSRIQVRDYTHQNGQRAKMMQIGAGNHSSMYLDSEELTNEYTKYYHLVEVFNPSFKHWLMLGGAWYSFPKSYMKKYPDKTLDVVEIDEGVTELAKKYFNLEESERMKIYHTDARAYLNTTKTKYDVIFWDAFSDYSIPYQLTTIEAVQKHHDVLNDNWVVILNIISSIEWEKWKFLRAEYATYKEIFPHVYIIPVSSQYDGLRYKNIMLIAMKSDVWFDFNQDYWDMQKYLDNQWKQEIILDMPILTDDFAPVNSYIWDLTK